MVSIAPRISTPTRREGVKLKVLSFNDGRRNLCSMMCLERFIYRKGERKDKVRILDSTILLDLIGA